MRWLALCLLAACTSEPTSSPQVSAHGGELRWTLTLPSGASLPQGRVTPELARRFLVVAQAEGQPLLGTYRRTGDTLVFRPAAPPAPGQTLHAVAGERTHTHHVPTRQTTPEVLSIEPLAEQLPANQLKFYLRFSESMRPDPELWRRVTVTDDTAEQRLEGFWHQVPLWSPDHRTATLVVADMGPGLIPGHRYTLRIDPSLADRWGEGLHAAVTKQFVATEMDHDTLDVDAWTLGRVQVDSRDALLVGFDEPVDRDMARTGLEVRDGTGERMPGHIEVLESGRGMRFTPSTPWSASDHTLVMVDRVEDLAGNTATTLLDARADRLRVTAPKTQPTIARSFRPG